MAQRAVAQRAVAEPLRAAAEERQQAAQALRAAVAAEPPEEVAAALRCRSSRGTAATRSRCRHHQRRPCCGSLGGCLIWEVGADRRARRTWQQRQRTSNTATSTVVFILLPCMWPPCTEPPAIRQSGQPPGLRGTRHRGVDAHAWR
jgi:hypothetical protein